MAEGEEIEDQQQEEEQLTPEELTALKERAAKAEALEKEHEVTKAKLKELEEDENNKDWRKARKLIEAQKKALAKEGKILDEETGEVKSEERKFSPEDIDARAEAAAERALVRRSIERVQKELSDSDKTVFQKAYEKAAYGETVTEDNVDRIIDDAFKIANVNQTKSAGERGAGTRGGAPRTVQKTEDYADTPAGTEMLSKLGMPIPKKTK